MIEPPASQAEVINEAEQVKARLASTFGTPPPEPRLRALTDEDKAAVARVAESTSYAGHAPAGEVEEHVSSAAASLRAMTSDLHKTDPEGAELAEKEAARLEALA